MATCYSCHAGGGPAEGIVQADGSVKPYTDPSLQPVHTYDRDFYTYGAHDTTKALISDKSIAQTISDIGAPKRHDWHKSGVMEADCMLCHIDPETSVALKSPDGLNVQPFRPRMMIFADVNSAGNIQSVSLGMPLKEGLQNSSALWYTNSPQRMGRPTKMMALAQMPTEMVGEMMQMWVDGLKQIEASGITLPYALYGQNVMKIWDQNGIKASYCANPNGSADEMAKMMNAQQAIGNLFGGFLNYMKSKGMMPESATMNDMMGMFFNDFIYAYKIKSPTGMLLPIPVPLRAYETGKFYSDWDNLNASVRDYVRAPIVEGEGIPYSGKVGYEWTAMVYGMYSIMNGDMKYLDPASGYVDLSKVMTDLYNGTIPKDVVNPVLHDYLPSFFSYMPTAGLMGLDLNQDGSPITYIRLDKTNGEWQAKAYYNVSDLGSGAVNLPMYGGTDDIDSHKWVRVCGQCHVMTKDHGNSEWNMSRHYNLGMPSDWVKNGQYVNFTNDEEAVGFDVHMSKKKMGCGSCHLREVGSLKDKHNFLKGTDTAHMVANELDNNPKPKTCESCHLAGQDSDAPNPAFKHEEKFGENTGRHIATIACETCHTPYRKTWRFRAFDDTLGYYSNFDNALGYNVLPGGDNKIMAFPSPEYALSPVYGTSPGYGIPHFNMLAQHIDSDGKGRVPMDYMSQMVDYFNMSGSGDPGKMVNGMPTNFSFDIWKYFYQVNLKKDQSLGVPVTFESGADNVVYPSLYYANSRNGYPQIVIGNPVTILTWVDVNPQPDHDMSDISYGGAKVLYLREINAAIKEYQRPIQWDVVDRTTLANIPANDPTWAKNPNVGKVILKDSGYVIFDHTGDMFPELWWEEDVKAMQEALVKVLQAEGVKDPKPAIFMAAHYFSDSHGVQPAKKALGAQSCNDCHGDAKKDAGAHRITDRVLGFLPWNPPWFKEEGRFLKFDLDAAAKTNVPWMKASGMVLANGGKGYFVVDGEVSYIEPVKANGLNFLGARQDEVLAHSKHHSETLFYMATEGKVKGSEIEGIDGSMLTAQEQATEYVRQVVNGPWSDKLYFYVPEHLRSEVTEMGFLPQAEYIYLDNKGFATAYVVKIGLHDDTVESMVIKLPFTGAKPTIWHKHGEDAYTEAHGAQILAYNGGYLTVKVQGMGEYAAIDEGAVNSGPLFNELWGAFMK